MAKTATHFRKPKGQGGRRKGFAAANEIEDMRLFDEIPDKQPSQPDGAPPAKLEDEDPPARLLSSDRGG